MNGRTSTTIGSTSGIWREVAGPLRRAVPWALVAAILGALVAGGIAAAVVAAHPVRYRAAAEFNVIVRAEEITALSVSKSLVAEQIVRTLENSRADEYAASAAPPEEFTAKWVVGPGYGEISYQVESDDPEVATKAAQAVFDNAGFLGFGLVADDQPRSALDLLEVRPAAPTRKSGTTTVAAAAFFGGVSAFALVLLLAVPPRRPRTA